MYKAKIWVTLRQGILDPAGQAVQKGLHSQGFVGVRDVRMGKFMELVLDVTSEREAAGLVRETCERLLVNPVMEDYTFTLEAYV
ncbi:MAG: Phosphoribosylformylglycinamidine synthase subunit PurS [Firmicutes bacterium]|nr:Phosphoribosylformylglycinamidine synthase subunit PurS [candidate division NPL-UPA2 bacterium]MBT9154173.1 Phosphoribosylformylglycinamidine synthase subunit PurS [candidate division NPL-UPA2 bacterium]